MADDSFYLELSRSPIRFDPVSNVNNVFFDENNRQVFAVRSGGATGVVVKGPDAKTSINFRMEDKGSVISIKFSYDLKILAIQRCYKTVEFMNFGQAVDPVEYSQSCKGKTTKIIGFNWVAINEVVFITDHGLEYYQVIPEKKTLKSIKTYNVSVNWFVYLPESALLLLSSSTLGNVLHPYLFRAGQVFKLPKFEVDLPVVPKPPKLCLLERDVTMAQIYGQRSKWLALCSSYVHRGPCAKLNARKKFFSVKVIQVYIIVLRHQPRGPGHASAEVVLYQLQKESPAKKTNMLRLDMSGRFAVNIVDNLIVVHHQASKTSMIFDIKLQGETESDGYVTYHHPVLSPLPIKPFKLRVAGVPTVAGPEVKEINCELYSPNWIVFQPSIIIDAKLGCLWTVCLKLEPLVTMIPDKCRLMDFLLLRRDCKMVILSVCKQMLTPGRQCNLPTIASIFDKLNRVYRSYLEEETAYAQAVEIAQARGTGTPKRPQRSQAVIDQSDMYTHVLSIFVDNKEIKYKFMVAVLVEYIRSLSQFQIPVQHYLYELVINTLVQNNCFYQLHQFLQYHVLSDSKPIACLMLSLESVYPPAHQLALDMLKRLSTANEEIIEVLLSKHQLLTALRFIRSVGIVDTVSARKFLEAAHATEDNMLFYTVFKFFEQRNLRLRGNPRFAPGEHCEQYISQFVTTFGEDALTPVVQ